MTEQQLILAATVGLTWKQLTIDEKLALVNVCNWPGKSLDDPVLAGSNKYKHLGAESGIPHGDVVQAVNLLAANDKDLQGDP